MQNRFKLAVLGAILGVAALGGNVVGMSGRQDELAAVRHATAQFHRVEAALAAGYELGWVNGSEKRIIDKCVSSGGAAGAMGFHYFHPDLMADHAVDPLRPEALVYAPAADGQLKLVAVEYVVLGPLSNPSNPVTDTPTVFGMDMHVLNPAVGFYLHHAWIWKHNPSGMFADWNPEVSCS